MKYSFYTSCEKEFKKLEKKYRTLKKDLEIFCKSLEGVDFKQNKKFIVLHENNGFFIIKARLFCQALAKNTLRIIFVYFPKNEVHFLEIYFKGDKTNEDRERIKKIFEKYSGAVSLN